jgi:lipid II:glycine glycyltransferase (peptidoglycan interpeptide bridge formation enzyme)
MVKYELIEDKDLWNNEIIKKSNYNPYQIYNWGQYKKNFGWKTASLKANKNGETTFLQITYKIKLNIFIGWCIGSIAGDESLFSKEFLIEYIKSKFQIKYVLIKSNFTNILNFEESISLYTSGWEKSYKKLNSDYTIYVDLNKSIEELTNSCSSNFRKNLKRGIKNNINIKVAKLSEYNETEISELFCRFQTIKDVSLPDVNELKHIKENLLDNIIIATSQIDNKIVGLRAFLFHNEKSLDFWAATDHIGRKNYTSFMLLFELFKKAKDIGINTYDMSGIDPLNNKNVFSFKNGLRAQKVEKLGEWEISNSKLISFLINRIYL